MAEVYDAEGEGSKPKTTAEFIAEVRRVLPGAVFGGEVSDSIPMEWRVRVGPLTIEYYGLGRGWHVWPGYTVTNLPAAIASAKQRAELQRDAANVVLEAIAQARA